MTVIWLDLKDKSSAYIHCAIQDPAAATVIEHSEWLKTQDLR